MSGLGWLNGRYSEGHAVTLTRGISPQEALDTLAGHAVATTPLTYLEAEAIELSEDGFPDHAFPELDIEVLEAAGMHGPGHVVRAGRSGDWAFTIQDLGGISAGEWAVEALSRGTCTLGLTRTQASSWILYAEDGVVLSSYDPLFPERDYGTAPLALAGIAGPYSGDGDPPDPYAARLRWLERGLRTGIPEWEGDMRLIAARVDLSRWPA